MSATVQRPLALTIGDPAGIGPEIILKAWASRDVPPFIVTGDPSCLASAAQGMGIDVKIIPCELGEALTAFARGVPVLPILSFDDPQPGQPDSRHAGSIIASIDKAVAMALSGEAGAVVTCPIAKHVLQDAGFRHPGHTEYLAELARGADDPAPLAVMMLASETLNVVPVTVHVALNEVPSLLTQELIVETARIVAGELRSRFGIGKPRLALAGLNPHAGESGHMGREEIEVIAPAIEALRALGIDASGPLPADTMFHAAARARYDAALCMYHDQALIPIKTLAFDDAVNVTLGLPFIRTSPDHGTAFDIAGRGIARPDSLIAALKLAGRLAAGSAA